MNTDVERDELLEVVAESIQRMLAANDMILSADDQGYLILEHHQTGTGKLKVRKIEIGTCISY